MGIAGRLRRAVSDHLYVRGPARYYQPTYLRLAEALAPTDGAFLDVGCGPGWLAIRVAERGVPATGVDRSARMLCFARQHAGDLPGVTWVEAEATALPLADASYSAAAAVQSAHHWDDPPALLREVGRVLRRGGLFHVLEADSGATSVPEGWIDRDHPRASDARVIGAWQRFGMDRAAWTLLRRHAEQSALTVEADDRIGFYRRLVLRRN